MIVKKQLQKVRKHYEALKEYKAYIDEMNFDFSAESFSDLDVIQKALLDAYLKRFASLQDYLGSKVFKSLLEMAGIGSSKMSEILILTEKEEIIDLDQWITFRNVRNDLEHDYPDALEDALQDLKYCIVHFDDMQEVIYRVFTFARRYDASIELPS